MWCSFGWVNASYVYGLQIVNAHMKRALGAVTPWDTFRAMTQGDPKAAREAFEPPTSVHVAKHVEDAVLGGGGGVNDEHHVQLPHSKEDEKERAAGLHNGIGGHVHGHVGEANGKVH